MSTLGFFNTKGDKIHILAKLWLYFVYMALSDANKLKPKTIREAIVMGYLTVLKNSCIFLDVMILWLCLIIIIKVSLPFRAAYLNTYRGNTMMWGRDMGVHNCSSQKR